MSSYAFAVFYCRKHPIIPSQRVWSMESMALVWIFWLLHLAAAKEYNCAQRHGGAFITLQIGAGSTAQHTLQWLEDNAFIDVAILHATGSLRGSRGAIPVFNRMLNGTDCDQNWSWHVDPKDVTWAEVATEVCDASPGYIEKNGAWLSSPGKWCPWKVSVLSVEDRRSARPQFIGSKAPEAKQP
eukprot:symbB.v1.2.038405.t1/scaffold5962.1/size22111/2